jgi:sulfatase maturation enzyme AslB (radical SAM superfamily)
MLRGELVEGCRKCFEKETAGVKSLRQRFNERAKHLSDRAVAPMPGKATALPVYWDIRFSNICNFRCRSCWYGSSSRWFADAKALNQKVGDQAIIQGVEDADGLFDQLDSLLPHIEEIYFAGGEPLLMDEHYRLLDPWPNVGSSTRRSATTPTFRRHATRAETSSTFGPNSPM